MLVSCQPFLPLFFSLVFEPIVVLYLSLGQGDRFQDDCGAARYFKVYAGEPPVESTRFDRCHATAAKLR